MRPNCRLSLVRASKSSDALQRDAGRAKGIACAMVQAPSRCSRTDLEEQDRALADCQKALREAQDRCAQLEADRVRLESILEGSQDAIWSWNTDGVVVRWNAAAKKLLGYAADEIVGQSLLKLVRPERWEAARAVMKSIRKGAWYGRYETVRVRKDGALVDVELTVSPIADTSGRIIGASTLCREISERKQFQASLTKRMSQLTSLVQFTERLQSASSLDAVFAAALDGIKSALGCDRASVLLFDGMGVMRFVASRGLSDAYRKAVDGHSPWAKDAKDPSPICVADIELSGEPVSLKETVKAEGIRALAFIPLIADGWLIGKFMTYYPDPHTFSDEEIGLANTIARQLALAVAHQSAVEELRQSEERFRLMLEHAPVMIWMSDALGHCLHLNRMLREFWGVDEADIPSFDWRSTMHPEDAESIGESMASAVITRGPVTVRGRYLNAQGAYRFLQTNAQPRFSSKGEFGGLIGVNVDVTEREEAEAALRESEERFRLAVEAAPSGMVMTDQDGRITLVNAQSERLFGYSREELIGQKIEAIVPPESEGSHPELQTAYFARPTARGMGLGRGLRARRKDGTEIPVEIGLSPFKTSQGVVALAAVVDISSRKQAEAERELLIAELNHRVKNTLSVVQSIAHQTFRGAEPMLAAQRAFEGRLIALASAHNLLTQLNWEHASLEQIAKVILNVTGDGSGRVRLSGPQILLPPKEALSFTMALHELCTNAMKYGALSNDAGHIDVGWTRSRDPRPRLDLVWRESGGPPVSRPSKGGFGSRLLERSLAFDLDGEVRLSFEPSGLVCSIHAPLPRERDIRQ